MLKRLIPILLILLILAPHLVVRLWLNQEKKMARRHFKEFVIKNAPETDFLHFKFTKADIAHKIRWIHAGEFVMDGKFYDVASKRISSDTMYVKAWEDDKETAVEKKIAALTSDFFGKDSKAKDSSSRRFKLMQLVYIMPTVFKNLDQEQVNSSKNSQKIYFCSSGCDDNLSPPPKF